LPILTVEPAHRRFSIERAGSRVQTIKRPAKDGLTAVRYLGPMYSESDLDEAVSVGVLSPTAVSAFRDHIAARRATPAADEEQFRLLTGFNDVFVGIALLLVFVPLTAGRASVVGGAVVATLAWVLGEFFTRRRRMALPSILLLLFFLAGTFKSASGMFDRRIELFGSEGASRAALSIVAIACGAAASLHWWRFKVPITVAAGTAALVGAAYAALAPEPTLRLALVLTFGLAVFAGAMWWDASDPERRTRRSDVAFWLHLLAAPLIAHPIFSLLGVFDDKVIGGAAAIIGLYALFALISLAVDRRALLVSGLGYFGYAVALTLNGRAEAKMVLPTALIVGSVLLLLSALWTQTRSAVVTYLPAGLRNLLPPIHRPAFTPLA
jgi:hypothetical protein